MVTALVWWLILRDAVGETEFELEVSEPTTRQGNSLNQTRTAWARWLQFLARSRSDDCSSEQESERRGYGGQGRRYREVIPPVGRMSYDGTRDNSHLTECVKSSPGIIRLLFGLFGLSRLFG